MNKQTKSITKDQTALIGIGLTWVLLGCPSCREEARTSSDNAFPAQSPSNSNKQAEKAVAKSQLPESEATSVRTIPIKTWEMAKAQFERENLSAGCARYVDSKAEAGGDGLSAKTAFQTVQQAVDDLAVSDKNRSKGCEIVSIGGGARDVVGFIQSDITNSYNLFCATDQAKSDSAIELIKEDYLDATRARMAYEEIIEHREMNKRIGGTSYSDCKGFLFENEKRTKMAVKDGKVFVYIIEKFATPTNSRDDNGERIVTEGLTGVVYTLQLGNGRFYIVEKLRAPSLPAPGEKDYVPRFP